MGEVILKKREVTSKYEKHLASKNILAEVTLKKREVTLKYEKHLALKILKSQNYILGEAN